MQCAGRMYAVPKTVRYHVQTIFVLVAVADPIRASLWHQSLRKSCKMLSSFNAMSMFITPRLYFLNKPQLTQVHCKTHRCRQLFDTIAVVAIRIGHLCCLQHESEQSCSRYFVAFHDYQWSLSTGCRQVSSHSTCISNTITLRRMSYDRRGYLSRFWRLTDSTWNC